MALVIGKSHALLLDPPRGSPWLYNEIEFFARNRGPGPLVKVLNPPILACILKYGLEMVVEDSKVREKRVFYLYQPLAGPENTQI